MRKLLIKSVLETDPEIATIVVGMVETILLAEQPLMSPTEVEVLKKMAAVGLPPRKGPIPEWSLER